MCVGLCTDISFAYLRIYVYLHVYLHEYLSTVFRFVYLRVYLRGGNTVVCWRRTCVCVLCMYYVRIGISCVLVRICAAYYVL